jgi:hypothetical protein
MLLSTAAYNKGEAFGASPSEEAKDETNPTVGMEGTESRLCFAED